MARQIIFLLFCLFLMPVALQAQPRPATVKEYKKIFKTYPYSDPNPIAVMGKIYPYFRYDMFTDKAIDKEWTVVELENDYIRVLILPEIGGKIWTAIEKSTGKPFIYDNQVVKFRDIAMRGPWTSGGIEANYGVIGHTPNCATPVDYLTRRNDDGGVSAVIGVLDLLTRTPWRLEITLPADKAYFATSSFWYNATSIEQPYYTWMNAGIKAAGNLEFIYPGTHYIGHNGEYASWPVNEENGKKISFYEENNFGGYKSYHVFGRYTDFFGGYWHDEDFGMARVSTHDDKAGKKIWIWGLSRQGMIWEKQLTDRDGQYVEVQSGRFFNQAAEQSSLTPFKHRGFAPYASEAWTEYWFPVKGTKGFVKANEYGALNIKAEAGVLTVSFCPVQAISEKLEVFDGEKLIFSQQIGAKPLETFRVAINANVEPARLRLRLGDKFEYLADPESDRLSRPIESPKDFDWTSVYGLYLKGKELLRQRYYGQSKKELEACLQKDPNFAPALTDLAMIEYRNLNFDRSIELAKKALAIDAYDPAANYYYGLASSRRGKTVDAKDGFDIASMAIEFRGAAFTKLSNLYFQERQYGRAESYAKKALEFNQANLDALQTLAVLARLQSKPERARELLVRILKLDPLNHFARFETSLLEKTENSRRAFTSLIRNEQPAETYLELSVWYHELGLLKESETVLELAPVNSEIQYWLAYLKQKQNEAGANALLQKANGLRTRQVFPFRTETVDVLQWAIGKTADWRPKYFLALIYWDRGENAKAWDLLEACGEKPDADEFYAARSRLADELGKRERGLADLLQAAKIDPRQWRYGKSLAERYAETPGLEEKALSTSKAYYERSPENYQLALLYAKSLAQNRQYREASELLARSVILPYEGATDGIKVYKETQAMLALERMRAGEYRQALPLIAAAREWPETLGAGKPYPEDLDERSFDWIEAVCLEKLGRGAESRAVLEKIVSFRQGREQSKGATALLPALALRKLGRTSEAEQMINDWNPKQADLALRQWVLNVFYNRPGPTPSRENLDIKILDAWIRSR